VPEDDTVVHPGHGTEAAAEYSIRHITTDVRLFHH